MIFLQENERFKAEIERMKHEQLARAEQARGHRVPIPQIFGGYNMIVVNLCVLPL